MTLYGSGLHILRIKYQLVSKGFLACCKCKRKLNCTRIQQIESIREGGKGRKCIEIIKANRYILSSNI